MRRSQIASAWVGLPDQVVRAFDRQLAGNEGRGALDEGLAEPGLADAGGADQEQVAMLGDPGAGGEGVDEGLVEAAPGAVPVDVLERGLATVVVFFILTGEKVFHAYGESGALGTAVTEIWEN